MLFRSYAEGFVLHYLQLFPGVFREGSCKNVSIFKNGEDQVFVDQLTDLSCRSSFLTFLIVCCTFISKFSCSSSVTPTLHETGRVLSQGDISG